jgi:Kef-type K+ transport system membrane component KefB
MDTVNIVISLVGALAFGLVIGWLTYRTIRRTKEGSTLQDISSVIAAVGGAAVLALFKVGEMFGAYSIGLAIGFFSYYRTVMKHLPDGTNPTDEGIDILGGR